jgi:single-stranded-DNA-specific exonuclease
MIDIVRRPVPEAANALTAAGVHPVLARVLASRGVVSSDDLRSDLATLPPFAMMKGIDDAAARLADAIAARERIVIVADYDADGATACVVGVRLGAMGANVGFRPNRFEYGYGLTPEIVAEAATMKLRLLVTSTTHREPRRRRGWCRARIDVLITDHHLPPRRRPRRR